MDTHERPLKAVPAAVMWAFALALGAQTLIRLAGPGASTEVRDLTPPPPLAVMRATGFGDPIPVAKVLMLQIQSFDYHSTNRIPYQSLDYRALESWLALVLALDPAGQYPLMSASRVYADVPDESRQRSMLDFVYREFFKDPDRRWPWLAHAAAIAKHRLKDPLLARTYAAAIQKHAQGRDVPTWARQMEAFILEDMNELETARLMIGGFLEKGIVKDESEARFLARRLEELEARQREGK